MFDCDKGVGAVFDDDELGRRIGDEDIVDEGVDGVRDPEEVQIGYVLLK